MMVSMCAHGGINLIKMLIQFASKTVLLFQDNFTTWMSWAIPEDLSSFRLTMSCFKNFVCLFHRPIAEFHLYTNNILCIDFPCTSREASPCVSVTILNSSLLKFVSAGWLNASKVFNISAF